MANSIRLEVLKRLTAHLQGINGVAPYDFDLSTSVFRGRAVFGDQAPLPLVSILEAKSSDYGMFADEWNVYRKDTWPLLIQGFVKDDVLNPTDEAYRLLADVELRLSDIVAEDYGRPRYPGIFMLGGLLSSFTIAQPVVRPPEDGLSSKAFFYQPVLLGLATDLSRGV